MEIRPATRVGENFQEAGHAARAGVRQDDGFVTHDESGSVSAGWSSLVLVIGLREDAIDGIDKLDEVRGFAVARMRNLHGEVRVDVRGIAAENDDAVGEDDGLFDIMSNDENRARGNFVIEPELEELAA